MGDLLSQEYAESAGAHQPEKEWLLTPYDTWVRNPHYIGDTSPHPDVEHVVYHQYNDLHKQT